MSKGGGGYDTSGMESATAEATALQKQIYEEGVQRGMPFYQAGVGSLGKLSDYLGIDRTPQQRQSIRDQLLPQYTTTTSGGGYSPRTDIFKALSSEEIASLSPEDVGARTAHFMGISGLSPDQMAESQAGFSSQYNMSPSQYLQQYRSGSLGGGNGTTSSVDYDALNAAVDAQLGSQERPDYYGSLLEGFDVYKFGLDPSYDFRKAEGEKAIERSMAASGKTFSPEAVKALQGYGQDLASQEYGRAFDRYNIEQQNIYNRLMGMTGVGQGQQAQLTAAGQQYVSDVGQSLGSLAQAQAAAQQAKGTERSSMFNSIMQLGAAAAPALIALSDRNLKENINLVGEKNGHNIYHFNYKGCDKRYEGVMAQEVLEKMPEAVTTVDGHLAVYYDKLGLEMKEVN